MTLIVEILYLEALFAESHCPVTPHSKARRRTIRPQNHVRDAQTVERSCGGEWSARADFPDIRARSSRQSFSYCQYC